MFNIDITELKKKKLVMPIPEPEITFDLKYEDFHFTGENKVNISLVKIGRVIWAEGKIYFTLKMVCVRCLEEFLHPVTANFNIQYRPQEELPEEKEGEEVSYYSGTTIDLKGDIRQTILLAIPIKPICQDGCQGLCPSCGKNLNQGKCDCVFAGDSRWLKLKDLLKSVNSSVKKGENCG